MSEAFSYRELFLRWPASIQRRGILTTNINESIPFRGFMTAGSMLLLERTNPDQLGARFIYLEYSVINSVKLIDPLKTVNFTDLGFEGKLSQ
jgi:hypothetical protein